MYVFTHTETETHSTQHTACTAHRTNTQKKNPWSTFNPCSRQSSKRIVRPVKALYLYLLGIEDELFSVCLACYDTYERNSSYQ